jgi:hypothetical protein
MSTAPTLHAAVVPLVGAETVIEAGAWVHKQVMFCMWLRRLWCILVYLQNSVLLDLDLLQHTLPALVTSTQRGAQSRRTTMLCTSLCRCKLGWQQQEKEHQWQLHKAGHHRGRILLGGMFFMLACCPCMHCVYATHTPNAAALMALSVSGRLLATTALLASKQCYCGRLGMMNAGPACPPQLQ